MGPLYNNLCSNISPFEENDECGMSVISSVAIGALVFISAVSLWTSYLKIKEENKALKGRVDELSCKLERAEEDKRHSKEKLERSEANWRRVLYLFLLAANEKLSCER